MNIRFPILILISLLLILLSGCSDQALQEENMVNDTGSVTLTPTPSLIVTSPTPTPVPIRTFPSSKYSVGDVVCEKPKGYDVDMDCAIIIAYDSRTDKYTINKVHYKWLEGYVRELNETTFDRLKVEEMYPVKWPPLEAAKQF
jgi:hypothetical protein